MRFALFVLTGLLASACSDDTGPLEGGATGSPTLFEGVRQSYIGGQAVGACLDQEYFQVFDADGGYTLGFANWNWCLDPERQGVGLCRGNWTQAGEQITLGCTSAPDDLVIRYLTLEMSGLARFDPMAGPLFAAFAPRGETSWVSELDLRWTENWQPDVATFDYRHRARLDLEWPPRPGNVTVSVEIEVFEDGASSPTIFEFDTRATVGVEQPTRIFFVDPDERFPNQAWQERLANRFEGAAQTVARIVPAELVLQPDGWLIGTPRAVGPTVLPTDWQPVPDICQLYESRAAPTPRFDAFCGR